MGVMSIPYGEARGGHEVEGPHTAVGLVGASCDHLSGAVSLVDVTEQQVAREDQNWLFRLPATAARSAAAQR
jgi:hypothetical protein